MQAQSFILRFWLRWRGGESLLAGEQILFISPGLALARTDHLTGPTWLGDWRSATDNCRQENLALIEQIEDFEGFNA